MASLDPGSAVMAALQGPRAVTVGRRASVVPADGPAIGRARTHGEAKGRPPVQRTSGHADGAVAGLPTNGPGSHPGGGLGRG